MLTTILSVMNAGKTARLLEMNFNYSRIGKNVMLFKPALDTRETEIKSRNGLSAKCNLISGVSSLHSIDIEKPDVVLVDEVQFLSIEEVNYLREISLKGIMVFCFGLKTDFMGNLFPASKRLIEITDNFEELSTLCLCGEKATMNLKYDTLSGTIFKNGNSIDCGYEDKYISVCFKHWSCENISEIKEDIM